LARADAGQRAALKGGLDALPVGVVFVGRGGAVQRANRTLRDLLGFSAGELQGLSYQNLFRAAVQRAEQPRQANEELNSAVDVVEHQPVVQVSWWGKPPVMLSWTFFPWRQRVGQPGGWGAVIHDLSPAHRGRQESLESALELGGKIRRKLASLTGSAQAVVEQRELWGEEIIQASLEDLQAGLTALAVIQDQQLALLTHQTSGLQVYPRSVKLVQLLREFRDRQRQAGKTIHLNLPEEEFEVRIDPGQIIRVLGYLVDGLVQDATSAVRLRLSPIPDQEWVRLTVEPLGVELTSWLQKQDNPALNICREVVEAHGGRWEEISETGTRANPPAVSFQLPRIPAQRKTRLSFSKEAGSERTEARILIADQHPETQDLLYSAFTKEGYRIDRAVGALAAVDIIQARTPELVILDWSLPEMGGLSLIRNVRQWSQVPVLVLSDRTNPQELVSAFQAGADDFVTRPFLVDEVIVRARALLRRQDDGQAAGKVSFEARGVRVDFQARRVWVEGKEVQLTPTEYSLLSIMARHPKQVLTYAQLLDRAWEGPEQGTRQGLFVHINRLRKKLEADPENPTLITTRWGVGYVFMPD